MERIKSFTINHNILKPGFYISRKDGEIVTYDLRTRKPNAGDYMSNSAMHSVEHMFATCVKILRLQMMWYILDRWAVRQASISL